MNPYYVVPRKLLRHFNRKICAGFTPTNEKNALFLL